MRSNTKKYVVVSIIVVIALGSFGFLFINHTPDNIMEKKAYLKWVEDKSNDLRVEQIEANISYEVTYCPYDYIIAREIRAPEVPKKAYQQRLKELKGLDYFKLRMKRKNSDNEILSYNLVGGQQEYYQRVDYFSYGFDENLFLIENDLSDTLHPALFHMERIYGVAPYIDFLVAFQKDSINKDSHKVFVIEDRIFGTGVLRFDFNSNKIETAPKLLVN